LTTKDQKLIFERTTKTNHTQQPPTPQKGGQPSPRAARSRFIFLEIASYKRCSRPLCSSQTTTPNHTPHTQAPKGNHPCMIGAARKTRNTSPGRKNPRSCCFRTQQCAKHKTAPSPTPPFQDNQSCPY